MKNKKVEQRKNDKGVGNVRLLESHQGLIPGLYESCGVSASGDVIVIDAVKGRIDVPLEKIEVIKAGKNDTKSTSRDPKPAKADTAAAAKAKPAYETGKDGKQLEMLKDDKDFYIDPYGQMTINKIDTPLGKLAQRIIQAELDIRRLEEQKTEDEDVMMKEMKKDKVNKIRVLGHTIIYQPSRSTNEKLIVKDLE